MPAAEGAAVAAVAREGDALRFSGPLLRDAVPALWRQALPLLDGVSRLDLAGVPRVDSAGVALLAELGARAGGVGIDGEPEGLAALRAAYRLAPTLAFAD
jgi:phospholipid transport system transporter-binding protein